MCVGNCRGCCFLQLYNSYQFKLFTNKSFYSEEVTSCGLGTYLLSIKFLKWIPGHIHIDNRNMFFAVMQFFKILNIFLQLSCLQKFLLKTSVADPWHFGVDPDQDPDPPDPCLWLMDPNPDPGSGSCYFRHWPSRCQQKTNFLTQFFLLTTFWRYIYFIFQR